MKRLFPLIIIAWLSILTFWVVYNDSQSVHRDVETVAKIISLQGFTITNSEAIVTNQNAIVDLYSRLGIK